MRDILEIYLGSFIFDFDFPQSRPYFKLQRRDGGVQVYLWQLSSLDVKLLVDVRAWAYVYAMMPGIFQKNIRNLKKTTLTCTWGKNCVDFDLSLLLFFVLHPGKLTWNLRITWFEKENHLPNRPSFWGSMLNFGCVFFFEHVSGTLLFSF